MTGIPCKHGVAAIYKNLERLEDYVHACFRKDAYVAAYKEMITHCLAKMNGLKPTNLPLLLQLCKSLQAGHQ